MIRAVLDCNIIVSALVQAEGPSARILDSLARKGFECVLSPAILEEMRRVLQYPRLRRHIALSAQEQQSFLGALSVLSLWVQDVKPHQPIVLEDPCDDIYIQAAGDGDAGFLVTGDAHLLRLKEHQGIAILPPRLFLNILAR